MDIISVFTAIGIIGGTGLCIGLLLGVAGKKFAVEIDEKEEQIRELLPGNNCGACGYAGCDDLAKAIASGEASPTACPIVGADSAEELSKILGKSVVKREKMVASIKCKGICDKTSNQYRYYGLQDCRKLALIPGRGEKACDYGCMGLGSCKDICQFQAIEIENGIAVIDKEACKSCERCVGICPNNLIEMVPYQSHYHVLCNSNAKGKDVKAVCEVGCIGCKLCLKQCEFDAIIFDNNLAYIDSKKCTGCGKCAEKCPTKVIG
ncbi:MAG: RnfABCDGE type electron transport complex subunit B [Lachnoclostridium sp.]|jgi:RnfABCDGE-type electron transport complex B subunit|nr:RnfABCDGE type electron transport complex subunit B [Lachnoclostridium sp.]